MKLYNRIESMQFSPIPKLVPFTEEAMEILELGLKEYISLNR